MPAKFVWFNGQLVPGDQPQINVYDHGLLYGDGVFEGIRVYGDRVLKLRTHLRRLFAGARSIHLDIPYSVEQLEDAVRASLKSNGLRDGYIRLCVTRGVGNLGLNPYLCKTANVFCIADNITLYPQEMYDKGMAIITAATIRNHPAAMSAQVKSLNYLGSIMAKIEAVNAGAPEALMLNHLGYVAECTADNIFAVRHRAGKPLLMTPPLHAGILEGVTRGIVMELAAAAGIEVATPDMTRHDLFISDEMFLTGTAAEVIPVTKLDARPIGSGEVGPVTRQLIAAFKKLVQHAPED